MHVETNRKERTMEEEKTQDETAVAAQSVDIPQDAPIGCDSQPDASNTVVSPSPPPDNSTSEQDVTENNPVDDECPNATESGGEQKPESIPSCDDKVANSLVSISERVDALQAVLIKLGGDVATLLKAVGGYYTSNTDSMHRELEKYRKGLLRKMEQELFGELIELYDAADSAVARVVENPNQAQTLLEGLRDQIDAALFNRGIEKRDAVEGEKFDPRRHHVARPDVPTNNQLLDGTVAVTAKSGFDDMDESFSSLRGGCMKLRPIWVRLYRFDASLPAASVDADSQVDKPQTEEDISTDQQ